MTQQAPVAPAPTTPAGASQPPASPAAPAAGAEPKAPQKDITKNLFADFMDKDGNIYSSPSEVPAESPAPAPATPPAAPAAVTPAAPASTKEYLDTAQLSDKWIKLKINGVETEMQVKDAVKSVQLEGHLTRRGQELAEQEKALREIRDELLKRGPAAPPAGAPASGDPPVDPLADPQVVALQKQLADTQKQLQEVQQLTADVRVKKALEGVDSSIRSATGFDDFMSYVPKIKEIALSLCKDPTKPTAEEQMRYDTPAFYQAKYMELKLKEVAAGKPASPAPTPAPAPVPAGGPENRPVPQIEGAGGSPRTPVTDDWQSRYDAAFTRAVQSGRENDWVEVTRLKRERPRG